MWQWLIAQASMTVASVGRRTEILSQISELVAMQYQIGMKLWGVVFLQPITDVRFKGSALEVLSLFRELIGDDALGNVVLATTQWSRVTAEDIHAYWQSLGSSSSEIITGVICSARIR